MPPHNPIAAPRFSAGNASLIRVSVIGMMMAAAVPCTARAAMSAPTLGDKAAAAEATRESEHAEQNIRLRPYRSPRAAPVSKSDSERQVVGVNRPFEVTQVGVQAFPQRGQGVRDDEGVECGHEDAERGENERPVSMGARRSRQGGRADLPKRLA